MKKFIFLILGLLFATSAFGQNFFGIGGAGGGVAGISLEGSTIIFGSPADSVIFEIPVSFEATVTIISTVESIFVVDGNKQAQDLARFINDNDGAVGDSSVVINKLGVLIAPQVTVGSDAANVDGKIVWIDASGGTGDVEIGSDRLTFSGFGGGVDIDGALTASTVTSDGAIIAETSLTINPTVVDTEDPSFIIKSDADSDGAATTSEALTINLAAASDPTDALWTATTTQSAGFDFDMPLIASTVTSDGILSIESNFTINPVVVDQETPSLVIGADGDSDGSVVADRSLTIVLDAMTNPNTSNWDFIITDGGVNNGFNFVSGSSGSININPGLHQIVSGSAPNDLIDFDEFLLQTASADGLIDMNKDDAGTLQLGDDGDNDTTFVQGIFKQAIVVGITAVNPGNQGDGVLTADINEVSTVGTSDDAVTLAGAIAGRAQTIINNGVNQLEIFPASGDDLGAGANTATTLAAGATVTFLAFNTTTWVTK